MGREALRLGVLSAVVGLVTLAGPSKASAQDLTGVSMTPVMTRLQQSAAVSKGAPIAKAFEMAPLPAGKTVDVEGVFKAKRFFKTWTIEFKGGAEVIRSDAKGLVLHVTATGTNGIFAGHSKKIELSFVQDGDAPRVRFIGRELKDANDKDAGEHDVGSDLAITGVEAGGTQLLRPGDGGVQKNGILITDADGTLTIRYDQNVIRVKRPS